MLINNTPFTTIWYDADDSSVHIIDQRLLPHQFKVVKLQTIDDFCFAIKEMQVRGAPLIGVTAAYGLAVVLNQDSSVDAEEKFSKQLIATRPTAMNLLWAVNRIRKVIASTPASEKARKALAEAHKIRAEDITICEQIGLHGLELIKSIYQQKQSTVNILTHCNAGWLATVDWGTALAPIYKAHFANIPIHVWVDETRPRNQGASLTAFELAEQGIAHTVITDNTGGHLMQHNMVDLCIVGSDRTASNGDVCNKIGTYLKALAAFDNQIPFYVALPTSTIDWNIKDGVNGIPIEQRDPTEVTHITGLADSGELVKVKLVKNSAAKNYSFDVTPARLVSALITEKGTVKANPEAISELKLLMEDALNDSL